MPAKPLGEIKTLTVRQKQKNGDVYVIERKTRYDPSKKYNVVLSSKIVGKILKGEETVVPTRPKRKNGKVLLNTEAAYPYIGTVLDFEKLSRNGDSAWVSACEAIDMMNRKAAEAAVEAVAKTAAEAAAKAQNIRTLLASVKALTESTGWSPDEAMSALKISVEDRGILMTLL